MDGELRVSVRNARFQQWEALLTNRTKRQRAGEFIVQGVRPITLAVRHGCDIRALLYDAQARLSSWATNLLGEVPATRVAMAPELLRELSGKEESELLAVVAIPPDDLARIPITADLLVVVFDRPTSPGNIGTLVRSADAFGASGVVIAGHSADAYDPKAVRASTGSLFSVPVVRVPAGGPVLEWVDLRRRQGVPVSLTGTDERATIDIGEADLTGPTVLVVGNETAGLSVAWRDACDRMLRIPITGSASSLNAATAASVVLYEAARQRRTTAPPGPG